MMLKLEAVNKSYNHTRDLVTALHDVTLEVPRGDFVSIVGPSGSGKSTLLLILGGMLSPSGGRVLLDGQPIYSLSPDERARMRRENIGFVFQTFNLVPYLSALENVQIPLFLAGADDALQKETASALLERVGLAERMDHKPSELSVGQQQRVALARMLANNPKIILADEPTGNLDPANTQEIVRFLLEMNGEGRTVVMVTHSPEAAKSAKRTLRLEEGVVYE
jgi:putative ABC transport system ATP-binding protein